MNYTRVIPRDLFNEASLLKCYGQLWLKLDDLNCGPNDRARLTHTNRERPFMVVQDQSDGSITIQNVHFFINGNLILLHRPLNSRGSYPLYATFPDDEEVAVFNDDGTLTDEFRRHVE